MKTIRHAIILGIGSDIGSELALRLISCEWNVFGTYRTSVPESVRCILPESNFWKGEISDFCSADFLAWLSTIERWSLFVSAIGSQEPVGSFTELDPQEWVNGVSVNSTYQIGAFLSCLSKRCLSSEISAVFFAGGGTNSATPCYSAQTLGKIALIKACELIDAEFSDLKVFILGPGWVKTKIHNSTIISRDKAKENYFKTIEMLSSQSTCNTIEKVIDDIFSLLRLPKSLVGGRNFSSVHDCIEQHHLEKLLAVDKDFYRLRRLLNTHSNHEE